MNASELLGQLKTGAEGMDLSTKMSGSLVVTLLAMAIVFSVLIVLMFAIRIMGAILNKEEKRSEVVKEVAIEEVEQEEDTSAIVAVIAGAVAASLGKSTSEIRVLKIERKGGNTPSWAAKGNFESMNNF